MPVVKQSAEQPHGRGHSAASLGQRQGRVFMPYQLSQQLMGLSHALLYPFLANPYPYRQSVDEQTQRPVGSAASLHPPGEHRPKDHVLSSRDSRQHPPPGQVADARRAHSQPSRPLTKPPDQDCLQSDTRLLGPRAVVGDLQQTERSSRLRHITQHCTEERLMLRLSHTEPRLRYEVSERRRRRQSIRLSQQVRLRLSHHNHQGDVIDRQVMGQLQQEPALIDLIMSYDPTPSIEPSVPSRVRIQNPAVPQTGDVLLASYRR